jgi:flagellar basal body L-ring protein FlgH
MRLSRSFVLLFATVASCVAMLMLATSCANHKPVTVRYSAPSTAPVQQKITDATTAIGDVSIAIAEAKAINTNEKVGHALTIAEARAHDAKDALTAAGDRTLLLDSAVRNQTDVLNRTIDEKNDAITERDSAVRKYHGLKFFVCLLAAGAVLSLAWRLRGLLVFIPPPYNLVAIGALPVLTFTFLWIRL